MTNIKSAIGAGVWATVATLMFLATLEPVELARGSAEIAAVGTAQANG